MNGFSHILLGLSLLAIVFLWRSITANARRKRNRHEAGQSGATNHVTDIVGEKMQQMELRLHDFSREVDGHAVTRLATLEQLIEDADHRIGQLDELMQQCEQSLSTLNQKSQPVERKLTRQQKQMVLHLLQAGYRTAEVANLTGCPVAEVDKIQLQRTAA